MSILAIDQGTTSTRGLEVSSRGEMQIIDVTEITQSYPLPGRVEHDPEQLLGSIQRCLDKCPDITEVGIDNQGESCLAWDRSTGKAITPVIVWQDNRTGSRVERMKIDGAETLTLERAGLPLDSYFSASKLGWILEHVDQAKSLLGRGRLGLGTTDAFFIDRLTGNYVTDISTASRTSLMNLETGQWDPELCSLFGIPMECLPQIVPSAGDFGVIRSHPARPRLRASMVDQQASLYGHGCRQRGDTKITFGTGAFALMLTGEELYRAPEQGLLPTVAWQHSGHKPVYALDGGVYCAGSAVNWARSLGLFGNFAEINQFDRPPAISRDLVFVPALSGLACPHWDRRAAGLWIGLSLDTSSADMMQALLEGIALRAVEVVTTMAQFGEGSDRITVDGGLTANPYFCQFLANVLGKQVVVQEFAELTAYGTAQLVGSASEVVASAFEDAGNLPDAASTIYQPTGNPESCQGKFARAVAFSKGWRQSA